MPKKLLEEVRLIRQSIIEVAKAMVPMMRSVLGEIKPETAEMIAALAKARGLSVDAYLRSILPHDTEQGGALPLYETATPDELARTFVEWAKNHAVEGVIADDSRESIYSREDEAV